MIKNIKHRLQRTPKSVAILAAFVGGIALASALFLIFHSSSKANDNLLPRAARVERVDGSVGLTHRQALEDQANLDWEEANKNTTLVTGDRIYAREGSRATVAFTGRNYARLDSGSALDVLSLADRRTQLALRNGSAIFDVGELADDELFEVATPNGAFDFNEPGLYQMGIGDDGNAWISVLSGLAQVVGMEGTGRVSKGEMLTLVGQAATQILLSKLSPEYAGGLVDDYYGYRYPDVYDGRYDSYDAYLDDPYYYDSYRRSVSYQYVPDDIPGVYDLDTYGDWDDVDGYGHCWSPRVDADWVPYRDGYWDTGSVYGPTWISQEPWGWAPYHYGRWAFINNRQWVWVPEIVEQPVYAPALVAFVPLTQSQQIGWVPLAPGEPYLPRYYDADFQPQYFASPAEVAQVINVQQHYTNINYTQAITVVPMQDFTRVVESEVRVPVNPQFIAQAQPMLDPYAIQGVRQVALADESDRRRFKMARAFNNQVLNTPVVTSVEPVILPGRENMNQALQYATVPEQGKKNRLKVQDSGQVVTAYTQDGVTLPAVPHTNPSMTQARQQQIQELANRSQQGDKAARHELKRLAREQEMQQQNSANPANGQSQVQGREPKQMNRQAVGETSQNPRKLQKQLDRQQMGNVEQRVQMQQTQELTRQQRKAQRRAQEQQNLMTQQQETQKQQKRAAQPGAENNPAAEQRRARKQMMREQRQMQQQQVVQQQQSDQQRLQKQQMKQQRQMQEQVQQRQAQVNQQQQMKQQMKQQRRVQEQQAQQRQIQEQQMNQQRQMKQQMKQQRQMQEQQMRQQQVQQQSDKQQRKAERRAAQQQQQPPQQVVQPQGHKPVQYVGPPASSDAGAAKQQRKAEKAQRKAGKGNQ